MAVRLGKLFGNDPNLWINLQRAYDLAIAQRAVDVSGIPTIEVHPRWIAVRMESAQFREVDENADAVAWPWTRTASVNAPCPLSIRASTSWVVRARSNARLIAAPPITYTCARTPAPLEASRQLVEQLDQRFPVKGPTHDAHRSCDRGPSGPARRRGE